MLSRPPLTTTSGRPTYDPHRTTKMADNEELIDYEDDDHTTAGATTGGAATGATAGDEKEKKGYVGIHSTGFR